MENWETTIGQGRERKLLDTIMDVVLEMEVGGCFSPSWALTYDSLCDFIAESWDERHLTDIGFTADDLAGISYRLSQLFPQQFEEMVRAYRFLDHPGDEQPVASP